MGCNERAMTYDEQRRALAAKLREFESARSFAADKVLGRPGSLVDADEVLLYLFEEDWEGPGIGDVGFVDACAVLHLAYLIDRPTCCNVSQDEGVFECSECEYSIILDSPYGECGPIRHCPGCGAEVIDDGSSFAA